MTVFIPLVLWNKTRLLTSLILLMCLIFCSKVLVPTSKAFVIEIAHKNFYCLKPNWIPYRYKWGSRKLVINSANFKSCMLLVKIPHSLWWCQPAVKLAFIRKGFKPQVIDFLGCKPLRPRLTTRSGLYQLN